MSTQAAVSHGPLQDPTMPRVQALAEVAHTHARRHDSDGRGLCLPVAAGLGWALREHCGIEAQAITGTFDGQPHWWLLVHGWAVDPTRHQFGDHWDLIYSADDVRYLAGATYLAAWTREQAALEATRAFVFPAAAHAWVEPMLVELSAVATGDAARPVADPPLLRDDTSPHR